MTDERRTEDAIVQASRLPIDLQAIRLRQEDRKKSCGPHRDGCDYDESYECIIHGHQKEMIPDIDALLAEVERLEAEIAQAEAFRLSNLIPYLPFT